MTGGQATRRTMALAAALALAAATTAVAQERTAAGLASRYFDPEGGVSMDDAIARALADEPRLRGDRTAVDAAEGMRAQAALRPNPSVSFERREEIGGMDNQTSLMAEWPLDLFRRSARIAVAEHDLEAARHDVADRERLLSAEVRARYGDVLAALRDLTVADEVAAAIGRQHDIVRARVEEGAAPRLERDLLDVERRRVEADRLLRAGRVDTAMIELKRLLGLDAATPLTVRDTLEGIVRAEHAAPPDGPPNPDLQAVNARPDVRAAGAQERAAEARVDRARREGRFDVSLFAGYMRMASGFPQLAFGADGALQPIEGLFHNVAAGAMVILPLRNRNQGEIAAARAERAGAAARREAVELAAVAELAAARARDDRARRAVAVYTEAATRLARQNLDVVQQTYDLGRATVFDVLAEERRYLETEQALTETLREAFDARTALVRALGERR